MLRTRLITAAILLPVVVAIVLFAPPRAFTTFIVIVMMWGLYEAGAMISAGAFEWSAIGACGVGGLMLWLVQVRFAAFELGAMFGALAAVSAAKVIARVGRVGPWSIKVPAVAVRLSYPFWIAVLFPYFALLRNGPNGGAALILIVLIVVASDSGAYFTGRSLGRTKLLPRVSPNKTVEGALGGLIASLATALVLRPMLLASLSMGAAAVLGLVGSALAQMGDLSNSALKRIAGVKDSGWIFPGHGGLLDRTCSLVFPAAFAYYFICH